MLETGDRSMVLEAECAWIERQVEGDYDRLLVDTSFPWLLPRAPARHRGPVTSGWPTGPVDRERAGSGGRVPGTVCVLFGDVHHAYASRANYPAEPARQPSGRGSSS
jgi:hypothetical protein